jgi:leucyl aminopeptidase (aminopeptidase T)
VRTSLYWEAFAEVTVRRLVRPKPGDPFLIITNTAGDISLAEACLAAGLRAGADTQLIVKPRPARGAASKLGPILSDAIRASKFILELCNEGVIVRDPATVEARSKGTRVLVTGVKGIEDYVVRALLDVDYEAMIRNAELVAKLWDQTEHCRVTSPQGTDVSFDLMPRKSIIGDGALTEDGEVDFFPGAQVSIAPVEETINGNIVIDASDSVQGVVHTPYSFTMKNGVITAIEGGKEADVMRNWLESRNDEKIYRLCHFSVGLNPQAGISGDMVEDERMLAAVDFGFGYQDPAFGGTVGLSPYHEDIMLATPTIYLDGKEMSGGGKLNPEMGFEEM